MMLLQEKYWNRDPWRVLVICILLNKTQGKMVEAVVVELFKTWPTAKCLATAQPKIVYSVIKDLGFGKKRTSFLMGLSTQWATLLELEVNPTTVDARTFSGCGAYALEAYNMVVLGKRDFVPKDKELNKRMLELKTEEETA